ncbi:hypothetical protein JHK84_044920 [Glycine max]|nr:hypothetical protein JHK86_044808 [Glycine max]KAG4951558.1 hypothetical protein JHK85_045425 [Glycine max]KAG5108013.1 hypothetical protein JHK84_044920 [Glycine max]
MIILKVSFENKISLRSYLVIPQKYAWKSMKLNIDDIEPKKLCSKWPNCNHDLLSTFENKKLVHMLGGYFSVGNFDGLYKSILGLNEKYFMSKEEKDMLAYPCIASKFMSSISKMMLPIYEQALYFTSVKDGTKKWLNLVDPKSSNGYAKGPTMFMATDDLVVAPIPISALSLLKQSKISLDDSKEKS